jgi:hypothetical protein
MCHSELGRISHPFYHHYIGSLFGFQEQNDTKI